MSHHRSFNSGVSHDIFSKFITGVSKADIRYLEELFNLYPHISSKQATLLLRHIPCNPFVENAFPLFDEKKDGSIIKFLISKGAKIHDLMSEWDDFNFVGKLEPHSLMLYLIKEKLIEVSKPCEKDYGNFPIHFWCTSNIVLQALIDYGDDVNRQRLSDKKTALHLVITSEGNINLIELLLTRGANPFLKDSNDKSPFGYLDSANQERVIEILEEVFLVMYSYIQLSLDLQKINWGKQNLTIRLMETQESKLEEDDTKISSEHGKIKEHSFPRDILAARSDYFKAMFNSNMKEANQEIVEIRTEDIEAFEQFLEYMKTGFTLITTIDTAKKIVQIADHYCCNSCKTFCEQILLQLLDADTISNHEFMDLLLFAHKLRLPNLKDEIISTIIEDFDHCSSSIAFIELILPEVELAQHILLSRRKKRKMPEPSSEVE